MAAYSWTPRKRNYALEIKKSGIATESCENHPLKGIIVTETKIRTRSDPKVESQIVFDPLGASNGTISDPLSQMAAATLDPLSALAAKVEIKADAPSAHHPDNETFEPWASKRADILAKFQTSEKLSFTAAIITGGGGAGGDDDMGARPSGVSEKMKNRLEQLDDFEEGSVKEMLSLSQQEYTKRIEDLNQTLLGAWQQDQRVKALKIVIQCSKFLVETSVMQFYPSKFVLITDVLEHFGQLVYDRLFLKAQQMLPGSLKKLSEDFSPDQIPETAKETARNWFFKIASIRELVPRFYVEISILKCYRFLDREEIPRALKRLVNMIRGIGDPLVSSYARCYLTRIAHDVVPTLTDYLWTCFNDSLFIYKQFNDDVVQNQLGLQQMDFARYLTLFSPAFDWIMQCVAQDASDETLVDIMDKCRQKANSALLINAILCSFRPDFISNRALSFVEVVKECEDSGFPKAVLLRNLGLCLVLVAPPENDRLAVLNEVWKFVMKFPNVTDYMSCAEVWIEYTVRHFGKRELNALLHDIIKHVTPDRLFEKFYPQLHSIIVKILTYAKDLALIFSLEKFLPFIDLFQKDSAKLDVCKTIAETFAKNQLIETSDPVVLNAMMFVCKTMHDSLNALSVEDEKRQISDLINGFFNKVSFGNDFEQQLAFFVEARGSFCNIDAVLVYLVQRVNQLGVRTYEMVNGNHSRRTAAFVRASTAFCFITIPSLQSIFTRLQLYVLCGQTALLNQCLSQADGFFKAAIALLPEMPKTVDSDIKQKSTEPWIGEFLNTLLSALLPAPDNPEVGVLYLLRGLLNVVQEYDWDKASDTKFGFYVNVLSLLASHQQDELLIRVKNVDSNDALYGSDPKYFHELSTMSDTILNEILNHLKSLGDSKQHRRQSELSLTLFAEIIHHGDVKQEAMMKLALNLWNLAQSQGLSDPKYAARLMELVKARASINLISAEFASKLYLQSRT